MRTNGFINNGKAKLFVLILMSSVGSIRDIKHSENKLRKRENERKRERERRKGVFKVSGSSVEQTGFSTLLCLLNSLWKCLGCKLRFGVLGDVLHSDLSDESP